MLFSQEMKSLTPGTEVENAKEDMKSAKRVGQYKISSKAIYKPDSSYLPMSVVKSVTRDKSSVHVSGCCAGGVWVERLVFKTESGSFPFIFDTAAEINRVKEFCPVAFDE